MAHENMQRFGKYQLVALCDSGATSKVWKAFDPQLKRYVAIKVLHTDQQTDSGVIARFEREAQVIASLHHPNIVQVHELQQSPQNPTDIYMVMDYIEGGTLREYIKKTSRQGNFPTYAELVRLFTSIAMAVDYAHQHGMIHRDIKPANILLDAHNTTRNTMGEPMLADFGLVKMLDISTGTLQGQVLGTPLYMAPERILGGTSNASNDIYSLGVILYEMCTGVLPFHADGQYELLLKQIHDRPPLPRAFNPQISDALQNVLLRCLAKEPSQRYPSASALVLALASAVSLPPPLELVSHISAEEQFHQQSLQQSEAIRIQSDTAKPSLLAAREQTGQISAKPLSTHGSFAPAAPVAPVALGNVPVRKVPNPETPPPPVDAMASLFPASQSLSLPSVVIHPSIKKPVPPKRPKRQRWGKTGIVILVLLVLAILSSLTWIFLAEFHNGTGVVAPAAIGQISFFSTHTFYYNKVDGQNEHAINDGLQGIFHLAPPASGNSYYAWLRTSFADNSGMYLTSPLSGNALTTSGDVTTLYYIAANQRNLLAPIDANRDAYRIFTIGEQTTTATPIFGAETLRYQAAIPDLSSTSYGTYLLHIQHLLSSDPNMDKLGLTNGLDFWFLNNVNELETLTEEIQSHTSANSLPMVQQWIITALYYLNGKCATDDIKQMNQILNATQPPYILHDTQVSLLDCSSSPVGLGYIHHILTHLFNLSQVTGTTSGQKQQIAQIFTSLSRVQTWLENINTYALKLIQKYMNDLGSSAALQLRYDMANNAELALSGQFDAQTQQLEQGVVLICDSIQHLASMPVMKG